MHVETYIDENGFAPFDHWMLKLRDVRGKVKVLQRIQRLEQGNFGDVQPVGESVSELRIHSGPGYRVYIGQDGDELVILLCAGDKKSQKGDIEQAKEYFRDYKARKNANSSQSEEGHTNL